MKKIALLLLMFVAFQVSAQDFHFLPKIGLNLANMTNSDGSMKPGLNVGVAAEFPINPQFSVEPGIYYSMQGVKESEGGISGKIKNDYINIPIYAKAYLYNGFYAFAGPQFGFLARSKASASYNGTDISVNSIHQYLIRWRHHIKWQLHELGWGEIPQWRPADQPRLEILKYPLAGIKSDRHPF